MKKLIFAFMLTLGAMCAYAQEANSTTKIVTGAVVDDNGNPLPGALVEATGGAESVTTDADGTFTLEVPIWLKSLTATYPGLRNKKVKLHNKFTYNEKVLFEMSKQKKGYWFLNAVYGQASTSYPPDYDYASISYEHGFKWGNETVGYDYKMAGLMFGYLGKWGGYFKIMLPVEHHIGIPDMSFGVTKSIWGGFYAYLGAGYSSVNYTNNYYYAANVNWSGSEPDYSHAYQCVDYHDWSDHSCAVAFEGGLIYRYRRFNINVGYAYGTLFSDYHINRLQASIGFCW